MLRFLFPSLLGLLFIHSSCQQCKDCSYTYTETVINQTPNGEVEEQVTHTGYVIDSDGIALKEECIKKGESFTIEQAYENEKAESTLDNFEYTCVNK